MRERGGFLRWKKNRWERIPLEDQRQKVAHALQYRIRSLNKEEQHKQDELLARRIVENNQHQASGLIPAQEAAFPTTCGGIGSVSVKQQDVKVKQKYTHMPMPKSVYRQFCSDFNTPGISSDRRQHFSPFITTPSVSSDRQYGVPAKERVQNPMAMPPHAKPLKIPVDVSRLTASNGNMRRMLAKDSGAPELIERHRASSTKPSEGSDSTLTSNVSRGASVSPPKQNSGRNESAANREEAYEKQPSEAPDSPLTKKPRIYFYAISSSHQLSAENAITDRPVLA